MLNSNYHQQNHRSVEFHRNYRPQQFEHVHILRLFILQEEHSRTAALHMEVYRQQDRRPDRSREQFMDRDPV